MNPHQDSGRKGKLGMTRPGNRRPQYCSGGNTRSLVDRGLCETGIVLGTKILPQNIVRSPGPNMAMTNYVRHSNL